MAHRTGRHCGCSGGSGLIGSSLEFFRVSGRRHHRDQRDIALGDHADIRRQLDVAEMLGVVDVNVRDVDVDRSRDRLGRAHHQHCVRDDVDRAAALHTRRLFGIEHVHGNLDADQGAFGNTEEVHVNGLVLDRIKLEVAWNHAMLGAVHVDVEKGREEAPGVNTLAQFGMVDLDHDRGFVLTVNYARHSAGPT